MHLHRTARHLACSISHSRSTGSRPSSWTFFSLLLVGVAGAVGCDAGVEHGDLSGDSQLTGAMSLWSTSSTPTNPSDADHVPVELGTRFRVDTAGTVTQIRFYKSAQNTGTHVGHLWSDSGALLGTATFDRETASGWQTAALATPVAIAPGHDYVVSYHTDAGHYADDPGYFAGHGVDHGALHAPADAASGHNGVYHYGTSAFPTNSWRASNYWVDVAFLVATPADAGLPDAAPPMDAAVLHDAATTDVVRVDATSPVDASAPRDAETADTGVPTTPGLDCLASPHTCGFADETNTGYRPTGVALTTYTGPMNITVPGTVIDSKVINGFITISANNVVIRRSHVVVPHAATCGAFCSAILYNENVDGGGVYDTEIDGNGGDCQIGAEMRGTNLTVQRTNIHGCGDGVREATNFLGNYIHDEWHGRVDGVCVGTPHLDGFQTLGLPGGTFRDNTIVIPEESAPDCVMGGASAGVDSCIFFGDESQASHNVTVDHNLFNCSSFMVRLSPISHDMTITNNRFGRTPGYGVFLTYPGTGSYTWSNNVWDDTGVVIHE